MLCLRHNLRYWKIFFNLISCASIWLLPFNIYIIRIYLIHEIVSVSPSHPYNIWYSLWYYGFSVFQATLWFHSHFQVAYIFKNTYSPLKLCFLQILFYKTLYHLSVFKQFWIPSWDLGAATIWEYLTTENISQLVIWVTWEKYRVM